MIDRIKSLAADVFPDVVRLRRTLHRNPELAFQEHETARLIAETLGPLGLDVQTGVAQTGVMATLEGARPGPAIALRADIDALPILEQNTFDFASQNPGKMHACGHDAHTASLLGAAMILSELRDEVAGTIRFLFQPSEEKVPGGALPMIEAGALAMPNGRQADAVFGQHVRPDLPAGVLGVRGGAFMASADEVYITVRGQGGHAAEPHRLRADAVYVAAQIVVSLQSLISRHCPPDVPSVLSFGHIAGGEVTNVIPETALLEGTFRAMDETWRFRAHALIRRIVTHTAQALGAEADCEILVGYPSLINEAAAADRVAAAARAYAGDAHVIEADLWFAAEDFAHYLQVVPGCFYVLGVGNEAAGITHGLHTPRFTVDEDALRLAPGFMAYLAWCEGMEGA